jgi:type IV secretory pathway TraG/TraD family ATPase VirD4
MADTELLGDFSKLIGERRVVTPTVSNGLGGPSRSETYQWERLAPVEELRTLSEDTAVVVYKNHSAARVSLRPYYEQTDWMQLGSWIERSRFKAPVHLGYRPQAGNQKDSSISWPRS